MIWLVYRLGMVYNTSTNGLRHGTHTIHPPAGGSHGWFPTMHDPFSVHDVGILQALRRTIPMTVDGNYSFYMWPRDFKNCWKLSATSNYPSFYLQGFKHNLTYHEKSSPRNYQQAFKLLKLNMQGTSSIISVIFRSKKSKHKL